MKVLLTVARRMARRRALGAVTGLALGAAALVPLAGTAAADSHVQALDPACEGVVEEVGFQDITSLAAGTQDAINCAYFYGITFGTVDGELYAPAENVNRYQMALFISRSIDFVEAAGDVDVVDAGDAPATGFQDLRGVPGEARDAIERLAALGIVNGKSPTGYDPYGPVNRRDMARFLNRVQANVLTGIDADAVYDPSARTVSFTDVPDDMAGAPEVYALQGAGIVQGTGGGRYEPLRPVRRDHMALYLMRHLADNIEAGYLASVAMVEAEDGATGDAFVEFVVKEVDVFADLNVYYEYDANDVFAIGDTPATIGEFEAALSSGDEVTVTDYRRSIEERSTFRLADVNPAAPAITARTGTAPGGENDVTVTVTPADDWFWSSVILERAGGDGVFRTLIRLGWEVGDPDTGQVVFGDVDLPAGEYRYRASVENDGDVGPASAVVTVTVTDG